MESIDQISEFVVPESNLWADFVWPEWVPQRERELVVDFWRESWGRGPKEWLRDVRIQRMPALGERVRMFAIGHRSVVAGRYFHRWNNIGALVADDGTPVTVSSPIVTDEILAAHNERIAARVAKLRAEADTLEGTVIR